MSIWKRQKRMVCILFNSDRSIEERALSIQDNYLVDERLGKAWGLAPNSLIPYKAKQCQVITDRDCAPITLGGDRWHIDDFNGIIAMAYDLETQRTNRETKQDKQHQMIFTGILILCVCILVLVLAGLIQSGALHMPSFG